MWALLNLIYRKPADVERNNAGSVDGTVEAPLVNPIYDNNQNPPDYEMVVSMEIGKRIYRSNSWLYVIISWILLWQYYAVSSHSIHRCAGFLLL